MSDLDNYLAWLILVWAFQFIPPIFLQEDSYKNALAGWNFLIGFVVLALMVLLAIEWAVLTVFFN